jgi:hypothetical protein
MFLVPLLLSLTIVQSTANEPLQADPNKPLGDVIPIEQSVSQFEKTFKKDVLLPKHLPFIPTNSGGFFDKQQQRLRIDYLNKNTGELCSVLVFYLENHIKGDKTAQQVKLIDDTKAYYMHDNTMAFDFIKFKKGDLTYRLAVSKTNRQGKERLDDLLNIANSMK